MCLLKYTHIANLYHDHVRPRMATQPFTANGEGDFFEPLTAERCECGTKVQVHFPIIIKPQTMRFEECNFHDCCAIWYNCEPCSWYIEERTVNTRTFLEESELEWLCPNKFTVNEYVPFELACPDLPEYVPREDQNLPVFPVVEMLYSEEQMHDDIIGGVDVLDELKPLRQLVSLAASHLWDAKEDQKMTIAFASHLMDDLEAHFAHDGTFSEANADPHVHEHLRALRKGEEKIVEHYGDFLQNLGRALTLVDKHPMLGETFVAPGGAFSISQQRLSDSELDEDDQARIWDGPLKYSAEFEARYQRLKDAAATFAAQSDAGTKRKRSADGDAGPPTKRQRCD